MMKDHDEWYGGILYSLRVADRSVNGKIRCDLKSAGTARNELPADFLREGS